MSEEEAQKIVSGVENKLGWKFDSKEVDSILAFTQRKADLNGKGSDYVPILFENELRDFVMRMIVNYTGRKNRCASSIRWI